MRYVTKKTALVSAIALLAGVSLASAQGQKEGPGGGAQSPGMTGAPSGGGAPSAAPGGAEPRGGGSEMRGQSGGQQIDRGRAEKPAMQDRTTGQGSRESAQPERGKAQDKAAEDQMKGKAAQDKAAQDQMKGKAAQDKAAQDQMKGKAAQDKAAQDQMKGKAAQDKAAKSKDLDRTTGQAGRDAAQPDKSKAGQQPSQQQTQQPQRQQGTTGAATQQGQTGATTQGQSGSVTLDAQKQATIQQNVLSARNAPRVTNVNFAITTGTVVPRHVRFVSLSTYPILIETFPQYRDYSFFIVEEEIVIIEPRTRRIVQVVPVGSGRASRGGSATVTSTEVLHLSEPEIREVQLVLVQRGLLTRAQVDGILGPNTREALITFQRREGLSASGSIDTRTVTALGLSGKISAGQQGTTGQSPSGQQPSGQQPSAQQPQGQQGAQPSGQQPSAQPQGQQSQQQGQTPSTTGSAPSTTGQGGQQGSQPSGQQPSATPSGQQPGSGAQPQQDQKK